MRNRIRHASILISAGALLIIPISSARAQLTITPTFDSSITSDAHATAIESAINAAIAVYHADIANPINVTIDFTEMTSGLGENSTYYGTTSYASYLSYLQTHATSYDDTLSLSHLPTAAAYSAMYGTTDIGLKLPLLIAMGNSYSVTYDSTISLNTSLTTAGGASASSGYNLESVVEHETDEALALGSGLNGATTAQPFAQDLFRYTSTGARSYTTSSSAASYFSIDGTNDLEQFNQMSGADYGDWASDPIPAGKGPQVQDAYGTPGTSPALGSGELTSLDVLGYRLTNAGLTVEAMPEPVSAALLLPGLGITGIAAASQRRRRTVKSNA